MDAADPYGDVVEKIVEALEFAEENSGRMSDGEYEVIRAVGIKLKKEDPAISIKGY